MLKLKGYRILVDPMMIFDEDEIWGRMLIKAELSSVCSGELDRFVSKVKTYDKDTDMFTFRLEWAEAEPEPEGYGVLDERTDG